MYNIDNKYYISPQSFWQSHKNAPHILLKQVLKLANIKEGEDVPIEINIIDDKQWIYYKDSALLNRLRYYPIYQLGFISVFMFIAYFTFSANKKSEQNQVWAGMAKEAAHQLGTPLSSLMAWVELLKSKTETKDMVLEMEREHLLYTNHIVHHRTYSIKVNGKMMKKMEKVQKNMRMDQCI